MVEPAVVDDRLDAAMEFLLNDVVTYDVVHHGRPAGSLRLEVKMAIDGTLYLDCPGRGKLYFGKLDGTFYFYRLEGRDPLLAMLFAALPRLPLVRGRRSAWRDCIPVGLATRGLRRWLAWGAAPLYAPAARVETSHRYTSTDLIETTLRLPLGLGARTARVELNDRYGIGSVVCDAWELRVRKAEPVDVVRSVQNDAVSHISHGSEPIDEPQELIAAAR